MPLRSGSLGCFPKIRKSPTETGLADWGGGIRTAEPRDKLDLFGKSVTVTKRQSARSIRCRKNWTSVAQGASLSRC
jgi:hypothetical protein